MRKFKQKYIATFVLAFFLCLMIAPATSLADSNTGALFDAKTKASMQQAQKNAGVMDGFLIGQMNNLFNIGDVNSLQNLVFGNPYQVWMKNKDKVVYGMFYQKELDTFIIPLMTVFGACYISFIALSIMISALRMGLKSYSPQSRADFWQDVQMWIMSAFFMGLFWWIAQILFGLNEGFVQTIKNVMEKNMGVNLNGLSLIAGTHFTLPDFITILVEWGVALYLNLIYIARKVIIMLLLVMAPVAAISLLYAKSRSFFGTYLKEFCGNIFLQSIHALVLGLFAGIASTGAGTIFKIGMLLMFVPITGMVSKWLNLGDSSSALGRTMGMMGLSGVMGAAMLTKKAGGVMKNRSNVGEGTDASTNGMGSDNNGTSITEAAKGSSSNGWQRVKGGFGALGSVVGGSLGLGFGGPAGALAGGMIGNKTFKAMGQGGRNLVQGGRNAMETLKGAAAMGDYKDFGDHAVGRAMSSGYQLGTGIKNTWNNIASRRQFMGNLGESVGSSVGLGDAGRKVGHAMSGVSQNRIASQVYGNMNLEDYSKMNPNGGVEFRQDNQGSAYYMKSGSDWKQISPTGAADPTLKQGEMRVVDYQLGEPQTMGSVQAGGGGTVAGSVQGGMTSQIKPGSTPHLQRTSETYIRGANGQKYVDSRVDASKINPDQHFAHNVVGAPQRRHTTDKIADFVSKTNTQDLNNLQSWRQNVQQEYQSQRHTGVV